MAKKKQWHKIANAYDAFWFLREHPKLQRMERSEITPAEADELEAKHYLIQRDPDGKCYRYWRHCTVAAIEENLDIFYTKTNKPGGHGRIDDDRSKNKYVECWLEFGPVYYGFAASGARSTSEKYYQEFYKDWDKTTIKLSSHDIDLDTGGSTFDEALVNLAKNVRKHYGDYKPSKDGYWKCGRPCGECIDMKKRREEDEKKTVKSKKDLTVSKAAPREE